VLGTARLLLDHGADPNAGYLGHGLPSPFTVLTGCFGAGELGEQRQPEHPHGLALARLLLERGADPNDNQALYNRQFFTDDRHLELLFEFGLGQGDGGPWKQRMGPALASPDEMVRGQLRWALSHQMAERVRLIAAHVDVGRPFPGGHTATDLAALAGDGDMVDLLEELGAPPPALDPLGRLVGALLAGEAGTAAELVAADPELIDRARAARPALAVWAAGQGRLDAVALLLDHGFDVNALGRSDIPSDQPWESALHVAASRGDRPLAELLLARGADRTVRDRRFDATPQDWAEHFDQPDLAALLAAPETSTATEGKADPPAGQDPAGGAGGGGSDIGG
jgi:ankyrin repeat protein